MKKHLCFLVAMLTVPAAMLAQSSTPPVKMGLWQTTSTITVAGIQLPPDVVARLKAMGRSLPGVEPRTIVTQSCLTGDSWKKMYGSMQQGKDCTFTNRHVTAEAMDADMSCRSDGSQTQSTGHIEVSFLSPEKMHGTTHVETTSASRPRPIVSDVRFDSVYQGADCKGISADKSEIVH